MMELKGKQLSLASKIVAASFVVVASVLSWIFHWEVSVFDIIYVGGFLAVVFAGVDVSLILEKFQRRG